MSKTGAIIMAVAMLFLLPAIVVMVGDIQTVVSGQVTLTGLNAFVNRSWIFIIIALFVLGVFLKLRKKDDDR